MRHWSRAVLVAMQEHGLVVCDRHDDDHHIYVYGEPIHGEIGARVINEVEEKEEEEDA